MKSVSKPATLVGKERVRAQISEQVEAFLRAGGKISVLAHIDGKVRTSAGSVWHDHEEPVELPE